MKYCPVCNEKLEPGVPCACGWDPSCDYDGHLSLVPIRDGIPSGSVRYKARMLTLLDEMKKDSSEKLDMLMERQTACEQQIQVLTEKHRAEAAEIQTLKRTNEQLTRQQQASEARLKVLEKQNQVLTRQLAAMKNSAFPDAESSNSVEHPGKQIRHKVIVSPATDSPVQGQTSVSRFLLRNSHIRVGGNILFGKYWQGRRTSDGKQAIVWSVLAEENGKALLVSKYALDVKPYNAEWENITWKDSALKKWLNGEFYANAFSEEERKVILKNGADSIFLLSVPEVKKFFDSDAKRICKTTTYAAAHGAKEKGSMNCRWWLRNAGSKSFGAPYVDVDGSVNIHGIIIINNSICVRPALWLSLEDDGDGQSDLESGDSSGEIIKTAGDDGNSGQSTEPQAEADRTEAEMENDSARDTTSFLKKLLEQGRQG